MISHIAPVFYEGEWIKVRRRGADRVGITLILERDPRKCGEATKWEERVFDASEAAEIAGAILAARVPRL